MDDLDRLYRRLVHNIRSTRPEYLQIPFTVRDLYERIIPYRHNRRELGIETNDDYETAMARLLSGERGYIKGDDAMQEALRRELASPTGDPGVFKDHGDSTITFATPPDDTRTPVPETSAAGMRTPTPPLRDELPPSRSVTAAYDAMAPSMAVPAAPPGQVSSLLSSLSQVDVPTGCRFCGGTLPEGRESNYCPHCGENLRTKRCPACGSEMDTSWSFCVSCGRKAG